MAINSLASLPEASKIAGSVMPLQRAEELIATLPGVISVRIVASPNGEVEEIHLLTSDAIPPKSTVRNVESALMAQLGLRVSHRKISVATSRTPANGTSVQIPVAVTNSTQAVFAAEVRRRRLYFEDIDVRRSRSKGVTCCVTLRKGETSYVGEVEGMDGERARIELAARAALMAIEQAEGSQMGILGLEGCKGLAAFEREFVFVGITARFARENVLLSGSAEVRESPESASVLAVLDATNRWVEFTEG